MGWFRDAINRGVESGVEKAVDEFFRSDAIGRAVQDVLAEPKYAWFRFVKHMQTRLHEVAPSLSGKDSLQIAAKAYRAFLREENAEFGDPRFDWTRGGARDLIQQYEIDHWEPTP